MTMSIAAVDIAINKKNKDVSLQEKKQFQWKEAIIGLEFTKLIGLKIIIIFSCLYNTSHRRIMPCYCRGIFLKAI